MNAIENCGNIDGRAQMLYYGPIVVRLVEHLAIISIYAPNISLVTHLTPKDEFRYLKTPESFRASLYQVACDIFDAFCVADSCMNKIHISLKDLPDYFEGTLEAINKVYFLN